MERETKIYWIFFLSFLMFLGIMLVDYGCTLQNNAGIVFESLFLTNQSPRIVYHEGLLLIIFSFVLMIFSLIHEVTKK